MTTFVFTRCDEANFAMNIIKPYISHDYAYHSLLFCFINVYSFITPLLLYFSYIRFKKNAVFSKPQAREK